jgi:hypothetical protein
MADQPTAPSKNLQSHDLKILRELPTLLLHEGYVDAYCVFGTLHVRFARMREQLDALPPRLRTLVTLFFLNETRTVDEVAAIFNQDQIDALQRLGIFLNADDGGIHTGGLIALPVYGMLMLVPTPHVNQSVYFGDDSAALACRLSPAPDAVCVDFCSGPGIQALRSASLAKKVVAVEVNAVAAGCAELNVAMNRLDDRIELRCGDLYNALKPDEKFDFISANPPLLPFVPGLPYPFVGHGGADGLAVTRRILEHLPRVLTRDGTAQLIGSCLGDEAGPTPRAELSAFAEKHRLRIVSTVPARLPLQRGDTMFEGLTWTCAAAGNLDQDMVRDRFEAHLKQLKADFLYTYFLTISHARAGELILTEHFRRPGGFWFR